MLLNENTENRLRKDYIEIDTFDVGRLYTCYRYILWSFTVVVWITTRRDGFVAEQIMEWSPHSFVTVLQCNIFEQSFSEYAHAEKEKKTHAERTENGMSDKDTHGRFTALN